MAKTTPFQRNLYALMMHLFGFLLLLEWVRPLSEVTDTSNAYVFVVFLAVAFTISYLQIMPLIGFVIQTGFMFYFLHILYMKERFLSKDWFTIFWADLKYNVNVIAAAEWTAMSGFFRSLLLFILLWLISYLLIYWILYRKKMFLFVALSVTYVAILDTFTTYNGNGAIIRLIVIGLILVGFVHIERVREQEGIFKNNKMIMAWGIPFIIMVFGAATIGYLSPKAAPQWPDPVPFFTGTGEGFGPGNGQVRKLGYGDNDSRLGGPFIGDPSVVFTAEVEKRHYWRVETKDVYTGKGWEVSDGESIELINGQNTEVNWLAENVETESLQATIDMELTYPHINYPIGLQSVIPLWREEENEEVAFEINSVTEKISTDVSLQSYSLQYDYPRYYIERLHRAEPGAGLESDEGFMEMYTQLPSSLPDRVKDLAEEITSSFETRYDKAKAVERYFARNGFEYETTNVAVPTGNQDYVDQFLFETQLGYCDNFSTSMVVMLRSVGIPARWVKGYTHGDLLELTNDGTRMYEISNNNAHSWVEVYFPEVGWVTFEPTSGFDNPYNFVYESTLQNEDSENGEDLIPENNETPELENPRNAEDMLEEGSAAQADNGSGGTAFQFGINLSWKTWSFIFVGIAFYAGLLFFTRNKWLPYYFIFLYKRSKDDKAFMKAYKVLLQILNKNGVARKEGQTLREYAKFVDNYLYTDSMQTLTERYERVIYRGDSSSEEWEHSKELWENLIKKASS